MKNKFDVAIIGAGVSGCFAALRIQEFAKLNTIVFDIGRPFAKRRRMLEGAVGCFPNSDGKLYPNNLAYLKEFIDGRTVNAHSRWIDSIFEQVSTLKLVKDAKPSADLIKKIQAHQFEIIQNDFYQWKPENFHKLSKLFVSHFDDSKHISFSFDNPVRQILKKKNYFLISTSGGDYHAKKIIFVPGRTGWRSATKFYKDMGMEVEDNTAKFGVRVEMSAQYLKDLNSSHCSLIRPDLEIGPFSWNGTVIPEDHADLVCSTFRSNEDRWFSEKVSFSVIANVPAPDKGVESTERMANLTYVLFNDRVSKEKVKIFLKKGSQLNQIPEYNWLNGTMNELNDLFPNLINKGYYHVPHISPIPAKIKLDNHLSSEIEDLYIAGEAAQIPGLYGAAVSGSIAAHFCCQ